MKDTDYGAPPEPKGNYRPLTDAEILDSDKFRLRIGEDFRDQLEDIQAAVIAHYVYRGDVEQIGRYVHAVFIQRVRKMIDQIRYESEPVERVDPEAP